MTRKPLNYAIYLIKFLIQKRNRYNFYDLLLRRRKYKILFGVIMPYLKIEQTPYLDGLIFRSKIIVIFCFV